ncbi:hypothetical protein SAMN05421877_10964 [Sphingobacterium lactis]|uniref:Uncharacterized protein n=1 Tax=Sphingobacterium lactis TaxID=797291 RepID=A0A1H6AZR8_9SPHI|nr:hypothetical protein SAMN05421877_10964 [Sphingobacterium lactis]
MENHVDINFLFLIIYTKILMKKNNRLTLAYYQI